MKPLQLSLVFLSIHCCMCSGDLLYYISPDPVTNKTCTMNGNTTVTPCYLLQQLCENMVLSSRSSVAIILLPGTHVIPQGQTFMVSNISSLVEISPWIEADEVSIECQKLAGLVFQDVTSITLDFLKFVSCALQFHYVAGTRKTKLIYFDNCVFINSTAGYTVIITNSIWEEELARLNISVRDSTFLANNGALFITSDTVFTVVTITDTLFMHNWRNDDGGALSIEGIECTLTLCRNKFINNCGGAIMSSLSYIRAYNCTFETNSAQKSGGAISSTSSVLLIYNTTFMCNSAAKSGGALQFTSNSLTILYNCHLEKNYAHDYGGAIFSSVEEQETSLVFNGTTFEDNFTGKSGGAIAIESANIINCLFKNNSARISGGAVYLHTLYDDDQQKDDDDETSISFSNFMSNQAGFNGGAIYCEKADYLLFVLTFTEGSAQGNSARSGGFIYVVHSFLSINEYFEFFNNGAENGGAIYAIGSTIQLEFGLTVVLVNNTAVDAGGAMFLDNSNLQVDIDSNITFDNNTVTSTIGKGGAIYVSDRECATPSNLHSYCFVQYTYSWEDGMHVPMEFTSNTAAYGTVLYGGLLDRCQPSKIGLIKPKLSGMELFNKVSLYNRSILNAVTSGPVKICFCFNSTKINCAKREMERSVIRGELLKLSLVAVDHVENPTSSLIYSHYEESSAQLGKGEGRKITENHCSEIGYHVFATNSVATLVLQPEGYCERSPLSNITIHIRIKKCLKGFEQSYDRCVCDRRLLKHFQNAAVCNIDTNTIERKGAIWLRYDEQHLKLHTSCPLDYCQISSKTISLSSPDKQCANHRSGVICGACQDHHSIASGGSKCLRCTSRYTFIWLTLAFAVAGVALVALLLVCNMTISAGTLNGLIFYANIVSTSGLTSLQKCSIHPILSVFIAWLNLDFGVETCFFPGMNMYQKTWLQFIFPLYIWLLVVAIIVASYYSSTAMKVFGRNNIAILATLFLLSYSKILKTIIIALSVTQVFVSSAENTSSPLVPAKVWTYDGNIDYLKGKHVALFTVAVLFLFLLFIPYTLLLILGQCVRSMSLRKRWVLWWIHSTAFISIMDAYHAPYQRRHRYWTGFMLLARCLLYIAFTTAYRDSDVLVNTYITTLVILGVIIIKTFTTRIYKKFYMSILELSFLVNLEILSATLYYLKGSNGSHSIICKSTNASISISFLLFIGILAYHGYVQIKKRRWYASVELTLLNKFQRHAVPVDEDTAAPTKSTKLPTTTLVELREELLQ